MSSLAFWLCIIGRFCNISRKTDANKAGTEKLVVSAINPTLLTKPHMRLRVQDISGAKWKVSTLQPMDVFLVKGWTRVVSAVACLLHGFAEPDSFEACFCQVVNHLIAWCHVASLVQGVARWGESVSWIPFNTNYFECLTDYLREVCAQEFWGDPRNLRGGWWPHSFGFSDPQYLAGSALFELVRNCRRVLFWATFSLALLRHHIGVCGQQEAPKRIQSFASTSVWTKSWPPGWQILGGTVNSFKLRWFHIAVLRRSNILSTQFLTGVGVKRRICRGLPSRTCWKAGDHELT